MMKNRLILMGMLTGMMMASAFGAETTERWEGSKNYTLVSNGLKVGAKSSSDRDHVFKQIPERWIGCSYVMTRMNDKMSDAEKPLLQLMLTQEATVLVGFDSRCSDRPAWLADWKDRSEFIISNGGKYSLLEKSFDAGLVVLNGNRAPGASSMYTLAVSGDGQPVESVKVYGGLQLAKQHFSSESVFNHAPQYNEFFSPEMEAVVEQVLRKMTLDEKLKMVNGDIEGRGPKSRGSASVDRVGIGTMVFYNGPRVFQVGKKTTLFPSGVGQAASFRPELVQGIGAAIANEFLAANWQVLEAPSINIIRDPLNGRNFEYFTEDPFLNAQLAVAFVQGGQREGAVTTAKHLIANNKETNRNQVNAVVGDRAMREIYLPAFKAVCDAGVMSLMTGANRVNGPHASDNSELISILKEEWGWPGFLYTDWNGVQTTVEAFNAGLDLSMPGSLNGPFALARLKKAMAAGEIDENSANDKVRRLLRSAYFSGKLEGAPAKPPVVANRSANQKLAYQTALAGMTLVKNEKAALPITDRDQRIAVIGPMAGKKFSKQSGGSSGSGQVAYDISAIEGLRKRFGNERLDYVPFSMDDVYELVSAPYVYHLDKKGERVAGFAATYTGKDPSTHKPSRAMETVKSIEVNWEMASPNRELLESTKFTAAWSAILSPPVSGNYTFRLAGSQRVYLKLDGELVMNKHSIQHDREATMHLDAGREYNLNLTFLKSNGDSTLRFSWIRPDMAERVTQIITKSVEAAQSADLALVIIGQDHNVESEGMDRHTMRLPEYHDELVQQVIAVNPRTIVVAYCSTPIAMDPWFEAVPGLVLPWFPGMENGNALAAVLSGDEDFGGRMPITFPKQYADSPAHPDRQPGVDKGKTILHSEGIFVGYRWFDEKQIEPLIPFGHGLSYAQVEFSKLKVDAKTFPVKVSVELKNTGKRDGIEVVQLYVHDLESDLPRPPRELKGFESIALKAGETRRVEFELDRSAFSYYNPAKKSWILEPGKFEIQIGVSSRNMKELRTIEL